MKYLSIMALACCAAGPLAGAATAQEGYPNDVVRIVLPVPPGGGTDVNARLLANSLSEVWGERVVVENVPGAAGTLGSQTVAEADADGHTLLFTNPQHVMITLIRDGLPYELDDFKPVSRVAEAPFVMVVHPDLPVETVDEFIAYAKENPGEIAYSSAGTGGITHLPVEEFAQRTGIELLHVPYQGGGPSIAALLGNEVQMTYYTIQAVKPLLEDGRVRALAVLGDKRSDHLPDVPAISEMMEDYDAVNWYGVYAPAGTSDDVVATIQEGIAAALKRPEMNDRLTSDGAFPLGTTPEEFTSYQEGYASRWETVLQDIDLNQ